MSSAWKSIKKGASSLASKTKGALKGDLGDIVEIGSLGVVSTANAVAKQAKKILPEIPDIEIPEAPPAPGATPGTVGTQSANVDLSATEGRRRTSGSAKGSRKLRVPLGGLGR